MRRSKTRRKRRYVPNTPIGRLCSTVAKLVFHASLAEARLKSWATSDPHLSGVLAAATATLTGALALVDLVAGLEAAGFVPTRRSESVHYEPGQPVRVSPKYASRYLEAHPAVFGGEAELLENLRVVRELTSGEYLVSLGDEVPFPARKTHLLPARTKSLKTPKNRPRRAA